MIDLFTVKKMSKSGGWGPVAVNLSAVKADEMVAAFIADGWAAISVRSARCRNWPADSAAVSARSRRWAASMV